MQCGVVQYVMRCVVDMIDLDINRGLGVGGRAVVSPGGLRRDGKKEKGIC